MLVNRLTLLLSLSLFALAGCATLKDVSQLPPDYQIKEIAKADKGTPLAVSHTGALAAVSNQSIEIVSPDGKAAIIAGGAATAIAFSPSGAKIVAALPPALQGQQGSILRIFDETGKVLGETKLREKVTSVGWSSESQVLATALDLKRYSFGTLLNSFLYSWDGTKAPVAANLDSVTIWPHLAKLPEQTLLNTLSMAVSPFGDEIAYTNLKDPPMFSPYLRVVIRHIESGSETEVGKTSLGSGAPLYAPDGETILIGDTRALTRRVTIPGGKEIEAWPAPGTYPAISPSGTYVFLDGRIYHDGKRVASFPNDARLVFLPDGSGLAVSYDGKIYQVSGFKDDGAPLHPKNLKKILQLRRLRSLGLITDKEYTEQREKAR